MTRNLLICSCGDNFVQENAYKVQVIGIGWVIAGVGSVIEAEIASLEANRLALVQCG